MQQASVRARAAEATINEAATALGVTLTSQRGDLSEVGLVNASASLANGVIAVSGCDVRAGARRRGPVLVLAAIVPTSVAGKADHDSRCSCQAR